MGIIKKWYKNCGGDNIAVAIIARVYMWYLKRFSKYLTSHVKSPQGNNLLIFNDLYIDGIQQKKITNKTFVKIKFMYFSTFKNINLFVACICWSRSKLIKKWKTIGNAK